MATALSEEECDITKCTICLEEFKTPKYLPCLHTFCELCLNSYITSAFKTTSSNGTTKTDTEATFNCPVCRGSVKPVDSSTPYQDWAGQFPLNHLIVTLIDQNKLKAKVELCDPCKYGNDDVIAVSWCADCNEALCEDCLSSHKKLKVSRNHSLQGIEEINSTPLITSLQYCINHRGKNVDAFCVDHDQPCCTTCIAIHHRKCDHVTTLEEAAHGSVQSKTFSDLFTRLEESSRLIDDVLKNNKENVVELEKQKSEIQEGIKNLRLCINKHLDDLESELIKEVSTLHKQKVTELTDLINELENTHKVIQNSKNLMSTCKNRANDIQVFLEMKKVERKQKEEQDKIQQILSDHRRVGYQFDRNTKVEDLLYSVKSFGTVTVKEEAISSVINYSKSDTVLLKDCTTNKVSSFSVKRFSSIYGGVFLPDQKLMLALHNGHKLVIYSSTGDVVQSMYSRYVWGVSLIDSNVAVVTRPVDKVIDFVDIQSLTVSKSVSTNDTCRGITFDDNKLYIGCDNNLLILNKNGDTLNEIPTKFGVKAITVIKVGEKKIVYTNYKTNSCHFMRVSDMKEIHTFTHKDLRSPRGVNTSDRDGNVYIAGQSSGNVFQISSEGKLIQIILSGMDSPAGLQFDGDSNRFFVTYSYPSNVDIYEMVQP